MPTHGRDSSRRRRRARAAKTATTDARLRAVADFVAGLPVAMAVLDRQFRYLAWTRRWLRDNGFPGGDLAGMPVHDLFPDRPGAWHGVLVAALAGEDLAGEEPLGPPGTSVVRWRAGPVRNAQDTVVGLALFAERTTHRAGALPHDARGEAPDGRPAFAELSPAYAAHDLNNLLTVILGDLHLLRQRLTDPALRRVLDRAFETAEMGAAISRRFLAGTEPPRPSVLPVDAHILATWPVLERFAGHSGRIVFRPGAATQTVLVDAGDLAGALINLIQNARHAMPEDGDITVRTDVVTLAEADLAAIPGGRTGRFLRVSVSDTGPGMTPDVAAQALRPHFSTRFRGVGYGLGLASVAVAAGRADGFVGIESLPGKGTSVSIFLPPASEAVPDPDSNVEPGNGEVILLVEGDAGSRDALRKRLEIIGFAVTDVADAHTALHLLEAGEPADLLLCDLALPGGMSGIDLVRRARELYPQIGLMIHSNTPVGAAPCPGVELLPKPATLPALAGAIRRALTLLPAREAG